MACTLTLIWQVALLKSLPTDDEIAQMGEQEDIEFLDGGDYLIVSNQTQSRAH